MPRRKTNRTAPKPGRRPARKSTNANKKIDLELASRIQGGDRRALDKLVAKYEGYAYKMAMKAQARSGLELEDLLQEARIGLVRAAEAYDPERKLAFLTFASWWVRAILNRYIADHGRYLRIPVHAQTKVSKAAKRGELKNATGMLADTLEAMRVTTVPIDPNSEYGGTVVDVGDHDSGHSAEEALLSLIEQHREANWLLETLRQLPEQERLILECRFFKYKTLVETAVLLHERGVTKTEVSRERIRQIQNIALKHLGKKLLYGGNH